MLNLLGTIQSSLISRLRIFCVNILSINSDKNKLTMKKITYQATLKDLALLVHTESYSDPELAQSLLQSGVTTPIIFTTDGATSRFGMKKLTVKDGTKRLNLAASNPEIGKLTAPVILIENSVAELISTVEVKSTAKQSDIPLDQNTYSWKNEKRNISEHCTAKELGKKYGIRLQYLNTVIQGKVKCTRGWSLAQQLN